jgi:hypothetical protein
MCRLYFSERIFLVLLTFLFFNPPYNIRKDGSNGMSPRSMEMLNKIKIFKKRGPVG